MKYDLSQEVLNGIVTLADWSLGYKRSRALPVYNLVVGALNQPQEQANQQKQNDNKQEPKEGELLKNVQTQG